MNVRKKKNTDGQDETFDSIVADVVLDENGNPVEPDSKTSENMFALTLNAPDMEETKVEKEDLTEEGENLFEIEPQPVQHVEETVEEVEDEVLEGMKRKAGRTGTPLNGTETSSTEETITESVQNPEAKKEEEFPTIVTPVLKHKGRGKRATYNKEEVDIQMAELVERYNSNMIRLEKTHLKSLERKKTIERIFQDTTHKQEMLKTLVTRIHSLEDEITLKTSQIGEMQDKVEQALFEAEQAKLELADKPEPQPTPVEKVSDVETETVEEPTNIVHEIPIFDDKTILDHTIAVKIEEAEMEAHRIKLQAASQATDILAEAQENAAELMRQAEAEMEELTRSITEAAEAKLADAEQRQKKVIKLAKERQTVHNRLIKLYSQQIGRLEKQVKSFDEIINPPSE